MCIFCKIVRGESEVTKLYEDEDILAFLDIKPINPGHSLIIPKLHSELISEVDQTVSNKIFKVAEKINKALRESEINAEGVNYFLADGKVAGQEVAHVHLHIIPRYSSDGFGFKFPDDYENLPSRSELIDIASKIKESL